MKLNEIQGKQGRMQGGGGGGGYFGWLAPPLLDTPPKKKLIHGKTNGNTWVPKNIEIRVIAMHEAEPSTEV